MHGRSVALAFAVTVGLSCGGDASTGPRARPVARVELTPATLALVVGGEGTLTAALFDADGRPIEGRVVTWTYTGHPGAPEPAPASDARVLVVRGTEPASFTVTATSEGAAASAPVTVAPRPVASVRVTPSTLSLVAGTSATISAAALAADSAVLPGRAITWTSSAPDVATVTTAADGGVTVAGVAPGAATVTAASGDGRGAVAVTVTPVPVASVVLSPATASVAVGGQQRLTATVRDAAGGPLTGRALAWASSDSTVATVAPASATEAVVTVVKPGVATVTAVSEGQRGDATITGTPVVDAPTITGVSPAVLRPGTIVTITGTGFVAGADTTVVSIRGVAARSVVSSPTQLTVTVPCVAGGPAPVRVTARGVASAPASAEVSVARRSLAVGEALILAGGEPAACNELVTDAPAARYVVSVFSAATSENALADFELGGNPTALAEPRAPVLAAEPRAGRSPAAADPAAAEQDERDAAHFAMLERNRADGERLRARAARVPREPGAALDAAVAAELPAVGATRPLYYTFAGGCSDTTRVISGRAIHVGARAIIWEDEANALQSSADAALAGYYQRLGRIFEEDQYASLVRNFGDPLLRDAATDADGRVHMVFSERLNGSRAAAYVTSCDQFARAVAPGSNVGQFFYGSVPTAAGSDPNDVTRPDGWFNFMARTVVHEVKHIVSLSTRVANGAPFEASWLEEGTARHAEELWVRESVHRVGWKANTGFGSAATNGVYCDFHPAESACLAADPLRRPGYGMRRHFNELLPKLAQPWNWSPYGDGAEQSGSVFYQTAWSLVRYAIDLRGSGDAAFLRALVESRSTGATNLAQVAAVPLDRLVAGWGLALAVDDYPGLGAPSPELQFPTWNLRSVYAGLNESPAWRGRFPTPYPVQPLALPTGGFAAQVRGIRGGAHAFFEIAGAAGAPQMLHLRAPTGGGAPSTLGIAVARVR